ncbi:MAG TPA: hypothetical protein VIY48_01955 [Candidatus Paceibacterota bacterium]
MMTKEISSALQNLLTEIKSTGLEISENKDGYTVTIFGRKAGAPEYATKAKQAYAFDKTLNKAFTRAVDAFIAYGS